MMSIGRTRATARIHRARDAIRTVLLALAVVVASVLPARADFEAGQRAWDAGHPVGNVVDRRQLKKSLYGDIS